MNWCWAAKVDCGFGLHIQVNGDLGVGQDLANESGPGGRDHPTVRALPMVDQWFGFILRSRTARFLVLFRWLRLGTSPGGCHPCRSGRALLCPAPMPFR